MRWYDRARGLLKEKGFTYVDIAKELGYSKSGVGHYLTGTREPSIQQIKDIAKLCGVSVSELLGDDALFISDEREKKLIELFRSADKSERDYLYKIVSAMHEQSPAKD